MRLTGQALPEAFVALEGLPREASGRLDRRALPEPERGGSDSLPVPPATDTEARLLALWQEKLERDNIGVEDNYFVLGGDSIRSIALVAEANAAGLTFAITDLFEHPTVRSLAAAIDAGGATGVDEGEAIAPFSLLSESERSALEEHTALSTLEDAFPLSMMQQGMVLLALKQRHLNVYENLQIYHVSDAWDGPLFERALAYLMDKHPMLKSVYHLAGERPLQLVLKNKKPNLRVIDLRDEHGGERSEEEIKARVDQWMDAEKAAGIDTTVEVWRGTVQVLSDTRFIYGMFIHHALWDGWSLESFTTELYGTYARLRRGETLPVYTPLPSYNRFIALEQQALASKEQQQYWQSTLQGAHLPWWSGREKAPSLRMSSAISDETSAQVMQCAARLGVQEKSLWCSVYLILLHLLNGSDKILGLVASQGRPEIPDGDKMVGVFVNALPLKVSHCGLSWSEFILSVDQVLREQHRHRNYPVAQMQKDSGLDFSATLFNYTNWHVYYGGDSAAFEDTPAAGQANPEYNTVAPTKLGGWAETDYLLLMDVYKDEQRQQFGFDLSLDTKIFNDRFRQRLQNYVLDITRVLLSQTGSKIDLSALLKREHPELGAPAQCNVQDTGALGVHQHFQHKAKHQGDTIALVHGNTSLSYRELDRRSDNLACALADQGIRVGSKVGICVERSADLIIGLLATLKAGACYVPLDPEYPPQRLEFMVRDSELDLVLVHPFTTAVDAFGEVPRLDIARACRVAYEAHKIALARLFNGRQLAYINYTSGSSGRPKGVLIDHDNILHLARNDNAIAVSRNDVVAQIANYAFDALTFEVWPILMAGGRLVVLDKHQILHSETLAQLLLQYKISAGFMTAALFKRISLEKKDAFASLRALIVGGEAFPLDTLKGIIDHKPAKVLNGYGPTETTTFAVCCELDHDAVKAGIAPIGTALSGKTTYVMSGQNLLPTGVFGELCIGGEGLAHGYLNNPRLTAEKFIPNPFASEGGARLYRTGDLVRQIPQGEASENKLEFAGRIDEQVKIRGFRVEPGELQALLVSHAQVEDAVVTVRHGTDGAELIAYVAVGDCFVNAPCDKEAREALTEALLALATEQLPSHMLPAALVVVERFQLTENGKVDRSSLPAPELSSAPSTHVRHQNATEELLANIWCGLLRRKSIGRDEHFFQRGGHSLLVMQLGARIRELFAIEFPVRALFETPILCDQAAAIDAVILNTQGRTQPLAPVDRSQPLPLSYAQQRLWFLSSYMGPNAVYNMPLALRLSGDVKVAALTLALTEIIRRHEVLRTRFVQEGDVVTQRIEADKGQTIDLEIFESEAAVRELAYRERVYPFDLQRDSLCRIRLVFCRESQSYALLVTMHHSISDGWSLGVFFEELVTLYQAFKKDGDNPLAPLPIQYADFAVWQRKSFDDGQLQSQLGYWQKKLEDLPPLCSFPTDRPRPAEQTFRGSFTPIRMSTPLSNELKAFSQEQGVTLYMTLLSAFSVLLSRYSGQKDLAVGSPIANRTHKAQESLIGFFVNTLVMRVNLYHNPRFVDVLKQVRETALESYAYQDVPFEHLVEELNPNRDPSHSPLFQVMFALQNTPTERVALPDFSIEPLAFDGDNTGSANEGVSRFDITFTLHDGSGGLQGGMEYNTDLFDEASVIEILREYEELLQKIITAPKMRVQDYRRPTKKENTDGLVATNLEPLGSNISSIAPWFASLRDMSESGTAFISSGTAWDFCEINRRTEQFASYLLDNGLGEGSRIGLHLDTVETLLPALLASQYLGGCVVPLDTRLPELHVEALLDIVELDGVVVDSPRLENLKRSGEYKELNWLSADECLKGAHIPRVLEEPKRTSVCLFLQNDMGEIETQLISGESLSLLIHEQRQESLATQVLEQWIFTPLNRQLAVCLQTLRQLARGEREIYVDQDSYEVDFPAVAQQSNYLSYSVLRPHLEAWSLNREFALTSRHEQNRRSWHLYMVPQDKIDRGNAAGKVLSYLRYQKALLPLPNTVVCMDNLPRKTNGLVDRAALPEPDQGRNRHFVAPSTPTEKTLCEVWQQHLDLDRVGVQDNYFSLGGDSIRSIALVAEANKRGLHFSVKDLFVYPTIATLAEGVDRGAFMRETARKLEPFTLITKEEKHAIDEHYGKGCVEDAFPLSMMQEGMVLLALKQSGLNLYENLQIYQFDIRWDQAVFERAFEYLMSVHPILKSVYFVHAERPLQIIPTHQRPQVCVNNLSDADPDEVGPALEVWMQEQKREGIDTTVGLWSATVHLLPDQTFLLGMYVHHALWDGWSLESCTYELYQVYRQLIDHHQLPEKRVLPSYNEFIVRELEAIESQEQRDYWLEKVEGMRLPWWVTAKKSASGVIAWDVTKDDHDRVVELSKQLGVQEKSLWCACYLVLLALLDGSDEVAGPVATQGRPEIAGGESMVGVFLNVLPVSVSLREKSWREFIAAVDRELREQHAHRHYPLAEIQRLTGYEFSGSLFNFTNWQRAGQPTGNESVASSTSESEPSAGGPVKVGGFSDTNYFLLMDVHKNESQQRFELSLSLDGGVFHEAFRARIEHYMRNILEQALGENEDPIHKGRLLGEAETTRLLHQWNTVVDHPCCDRIEALFERQAEWQPEATALVVTNTGGCAAHLTYSELNHRADWLAHHLCAAGASSGARVGLCLERSPDVVIAIFAILKAGAAYVPLDPTQPEHRIAYIIDDAELDLVVTTQNLIGKLSAERPFECITLDTLRKASASGPSHLEIQSTALIKSAAEDLAYIIYTSGSTGNPKGALVSHRNVVRLFLATDRHFQFSREDVWTLFHSYAFDFSVWEMFGALCHGGSLVVVPSSVAQSPRDFYHLLSKQRVTILNQTPTLFNQLVDIDREAELALALRAVILGGEALEPERLLPWFDRHDENTVQLINMYGITETTVHVTFKRLGRQDLELSSVVNIGRKIDDLGLYLLDQHLAPVPTGVPAEIYVGGSGVTQGYLRRDELTQQKFLSNPHSEGDRLYKTGDLGRFLENGDLEYLGRIDHQVKIRGFRIELGEIESLLLQMDGVKSAVVLARQDEPDNKYLMAYIVSDQQNLGNAAREFLQSRVPAYMVPTGIVTLGAFPLTVGGKIDVRALSAMRPEQPETAYIAPNSAVERQLSAYWQQMFNCDRVGVGDNFWNLGGHSLLMMRFNNYLRGEFGIDLPVAKMFEYQTLQEFANLVELELDKAQLKHTRAILDNVQNDEEVEEGSF
ncbi:amino acid adenylation domain-containing protein [Microbulbifer sp. TYP-18]|uniref:amino acid adenylation domain-containing protein n=1 Tax=Microbulbifer sp. TYP-18 TaxID=3230024 RepID=UPI0034C5DFFC